MDNKLFYDIAIDYQTGDSFNTESIKGERIGIITSDLDKAKENLLRIKKQYLKYLDIDEEKSNTNLDDEIEMYPAFKTQMNKLNSQYIKTVYVALFLMIVNFVVSGSIVYQNYAGSNTLTTFVSFFMLVSMKLYSAYNVGTISVKDERANSAYMKMPKTYNTIDEDHRLTIAPTNVNVII